MQGEMHFDIPLQISLLHMQQFAEYSKSNRLTQYDLSPFIRSYSAKVTLESETKAQILDVLWQPGCGFVVGGLDLDAAGLRADWA